MNRKTKQHIITKLPRLGFFIFLLFHNWPALASYFLQITDRTVTLSHRITCLAVQSDVLTAAICLCSSKLHDLNKNVLTHMNMDYVIFICQVNYRSELSISCEIFKSHCFVFYRIISHVGQTAGNNGLNNMSICHLTLHV